MPKPSPFYKDNFVGATQKIVDDQGAQKSQCDGVVAVIDTIGSVRVQLRGATNFTKADVSSGIKVAVGDKVVLRRSNETARWVIIQNYGQGTSATTSAASNVSSSGAGVAAPVNFVAVGQADGILFTWTPLSPDGGFVFEIDIADDNIDTNSVKYQVSGSMWYLPISGTHYCRIRGVGLDWSRSGWSGWVVATADDEITDILKTQVFGRR